MSVRIDIPGPAVGGARMPRHVRVFNVKDDGSEAEITEVRSIRIKIDLDDVMRAEIDTFLVGPASIMAHGVVSTVCPYCGVTTNVSEHP